jgi:hypothetical protein
MSAVPRLSSCLPPACETAGPPPERAIIVTLATWPNTHLVAGWGNAHCHQSRGLVAAGSMMLQIDRISRPACEALGGRVSAWASVNVEKAVRDPRADRRAPVGGVGRTQAVASRGRRGGCQTAVRAAPAAACSRGRDGARRRSAGCAPASTRACHLGITCRVSIAARSSAPFMDGSGRRSRPLPAGDDAIDPERSGRQTPAGPTAYPRMANSRCIATRGSRPAFVLARAWEGLGFVTARVRNELLGEDGRGCCSVMDGAARRRRRRAVAARPERKRPLVGGRQMPTTRTVVLRTNAGASPALSDDRPDRVCRHPPRVW